MRMSGSLPTRKTSVNSFSITNFGRPKPLELTKTLVTKEEKKIHDCNHYDNTDDHNVFASDENLDLKYARDSSNSDSGCPSASSDDDTPTLPEESYSFLKGQRSQNIPLMRGMSRQFSIDSQSESDQSEQCGYSFDAGLFKPRFQRQLSLPGEISSMTEDNISSTTNQKLRKSSMCSSNESLDSSDSTAGNLAPGVQRMLGKLRRGSGTLYRSGTDNIVPLYLSKSYERPTRNIQAVQRVSTPIVMGRQAPKLDLDQRRPFQMPAALTPRRGYRRGSETNTDNFNPVGSDNINVGRVVPKSDVLRTPTNVDLSRLPPETIERLRNLSNNPFKDNVIKVKADHRFKVSDPSSPRKYSDFTDPYSTDVPMEVEMKTKVKEATMKFRVEQTITGIAKPGLKRCGRSGSKTIQSQPTSRSQSPTRGDDDVDREMALAFRSAFENASWRKEY